MEARAMDSHRFSDALSVMSRVAVFGPSDPECGAERVSEACRVLASQDWAAEQLLPESLSPRIVEHYGLSQSLLTAADRCLLLLSFAAAGVASCPWPQGAGSGAFALEWVLFSVRHFLSKVLPQHPYGAIGTVQGLVQGIGLRVVRLCLPHARAMGEGAALHRAACRWYFGALAEVPGCDDPLQAMLDSMEGWTERILEFFAEEAASLILAGADFLGSEDPRVGSGAGGESDPSHPSSARIAELIAYLLHNKLLGNADTRLYTGKKNDIIFHQILEDRLFKSPPPSDDPSGPGFASCFPLDPVRLFEGCLYFSDVVQVTSRRFIHLLVQVLHYDRKRFKSLPSERTAVLVGLLSRLIAECTGTLRDPSVSLGVRSTGSVYFKTNYCLEILRFLLNSGRISPVDLAKACGDALSDLIRLSIDLPRMTPQFAEEHNSMPILNVFVDTLPGILILLFENPVSRAELMRAAMRSGTLGRLRAALRAVQPYARTRPTDPAPEAPTIIGLPFNENLRRTYDGTFATYLHGLGTKTEREPGGLGDLAAEPVSALALLASLTFPTNPTPDDIGSFLHHLWVYSAPLRHPSFKSRLLALSAPLGRETVTGLHVLALKALNFDSLLISLEPAADAISEVTGGWAVQGLTEAVCDLHGVLSMIAEEASRQLRAEGGGMVKKGGRARVAARQRRLRLTVLESQYGGWRKRLRGLRKRLLLEHLPRAERRDEAAWVLSSEEVVGLVRGAREGRRG